MGTLYILQSQSTGRFYVGSTDNLGRRLNEHQRGKSLATRGRGPWNLVHSEQFESLAAARHREREIKRWKSARAIQAVLAQSAERADLIG